MFITETTETADDQRHEATAIHSNEEVKNLEETSQDLPKTPDYQRRLPTRDQAAAHPRIGLKKQRQMRDSKPNFSPEQTPVSTLTNTTIFQSKPLEKTSQNTSPTFNPLISEKLLTTTSLDRATLCQHPCKSTPCRLFTANEMLWLVRRQDPVKLLLFFSQF